MYEVEIEIKPLARKKWVCGLKWGGVRKRDSGAVISRDERRAGRLTTEAVKGGLRAPCEVLRLEGLEPRTVSTSSAVRSS